MLYIFVQRDRAEAEEEFQMFLSEELINPVGIGIAEESSSSFIYIIIQTSRFPSL